MLSARLQWWPHNHFIDDFADDRRQAPRCEVKLRVSLRFSASPPKARANDRAPASSEMIGETRNLSEKGLAVCVPSNRIDRRYLNVVGCELDLTLDLPTGPVGLRATPIWCKRLLEERLTEGYLVGLRIIEMSDREWVRLVRYVHSFL